MQGNPFSLKKIDINRSPGRESIKESSLFMYNT